MPGLLGKLVGDRQLYRKPLKTRLYPLMVCSSAHIQQCLGYYSKVSINHVLQCRGGLQPSSKFTFVSTATARQRKVPTKKPSNASDKKTLPVICDTQQLLPSLESGTTVLTPSSSVAQVFGDDSFAQTFDTSVAQMCLPSSFDDPRIEDFCYNAVNMAEVTSSESTAPPLPGVMEFYDDPRLGYFGYDAQGPTVNLEPPPASLLTGFEASGNGFGVAYHT